MQSVNLVVHRINRSLGRSSVCQLSEQEIESNFISLSLAFKSDKLTLDQRVIVQERSRDIAEKNVDTELQGLREAIQMLNELVTSSKVRHVLQKMKEHIHVLEQSSARLSSKAEVFGAVQQERKMSQSMEIMVQYTENLRRLREREESELQEARKLLSERTGNSFSFDSDTSPVRRSTSVCGYSPVTRPTRRRSDIALPRVIGGTGSPQLNQTVPLDNSNSVDMVLLKSTNSQELENIENPRSRFQSVVASTSMKQVVAATIRKWAVDKQRSVSLSTGASPYLLVNQCSEETLDTTAAQLSLRSAAVSCSAPLLDEHKPGAGRHIPMDEEAFRKGYEQGLKTVLSQELSDLASQQSSLSLSLEQVMGAVGTSSLVGTGYWYRQAWLQLPTKFLANLEEFIMSLCQVGWQPHHLPGRSLLALVFLMLALLVIVMSPPAS